MDGSPRITWARRPRCRPRARVRSPCAEPLPGIRFEVGSVDELDTDAASVGGVLAWYSLIHREPGDIQTPLREFARVVRPGGGLLVGFFTWPSLERFPHAVIDGYRWPVGDLAAEIEAAGFQVIETYERRETGARPQGAILARRMPTSIVG